MTERILDLPIVVVDDEPSNVALLERLLARAGYTAVHSTTDPRHVEPLITEHQPALVLLDLHMPHIGGLELLERLHEQRVPGRPHLPVLVLTADVSPEARTRALGAGATDFVTKPFEPVEIRLRIRNALRTSQLARDLAAANRDLEDRVRARTEQLERANEDLRQLDRLRRDLLSMASHEFRTPVTILRGLTETWVTRRPPPDTDQGSRELRAAFRSVVRLERLMDNFLLGARIEAGAVELRRRPIELRAVVTAVVDALDVASEVTLDCPPGQQAQADEALVHRIVSNLVTNALRYGAPPVEVRAWASEGSGHIRVRDHGAGIPEEFRDALFRPFSQASTGDTRTATGAGLGLWISHRLAQLQGGELRYRDAQPTGAVFELDLPS